MLIVKTEMSVQQAAPCMGMHFNNARLQMSRFIPEHTHMDTHTDSHTDTHRLTHMDTHTDTHRHTHTDTQHTHTGATIPDLVSIPFQFSQESN